VEVRRGEQCLTTLRAEVRQMTIGDDWFAAVGR
jgi:hypothetical protein